MSRLAAFRRLALHRDAALLLQAVALTLSLGLPARAEAGAMGAGPGMTCAEFSMMDAAGQMQAMATMAATGADAMATDAMATDAMANDAPATGPMAASHDDVIATVDACAGHADMMAVDAMHAVAH